MSSAPDDDSAGAARERQGQLELALDATRSERHDLDRLLKTFEDGKLDRNQIVSKLMVLYQTGIGGAARGLAELDKEAAQELAKRLRQRIESFLSELDEQSRSPTVTANKTPASDRLKSKSSPVLQREYVLFQALTATDQEIPSSTLMGKVRSVDSEIADATVTAHLDRLMKDGLIVRERKGLYRGTPRSKAYFTSLKAEIEVRGLPFPT